MHLGNGALTPECAALAFGAASAGLAAASIRICHEPITRQKVSLAAALGAFVFAAQALNVPVLPGISAHLVGGALLAWTLGPSLGAWTMAMILAAQALLLGDGGVTALGANIVNMALIPAGGIWILQRLDVKQPHLVALVAFASVVSAAALIPLETALFRSASELSGWSGFASRMIVTHVAAGFAEGAMTLLLLFAFSHGGSPAPFRVQRSWKLTLGRATLCLALLATLFICRSQHPDGYEAAATKSGMAWLLE